MSFDILLLCGATTAAIFLLLPIKEFKNSYFSIAIIALGILIVAYTLKSGAPLFEYIKGFMDTELSIYFKLLFKVLGITLICSLTSDLATELGMSSLSSKVDFAGKVAILLCSVSTFDNLFEQLKVLML